MSTKATGASGEAPAPTSTNRERQGSQQAYKSRPPRQRNAGHYHHHHRRGAGDSPTTPRTASALERFGPLLEPFGFSKNQIRKMVVECNHDVEAMALKVQQLVDNKFSAEQNENEWQAVGKSSSSRQTARRTQQDERPERRGQQREGGNERRREGPAERYTAKSRDTVQQTGPRKSYGDRQAQRTTVRGGDRNTRDQQQRPSVEAAARRQQQQQQPAPRKTEQFKGPTWADRVRGGPPPSAAPEQEAVPLIKEQQVPVAEAPVAAPAELPSAPLTAHATETVEESRPASPPAHPVIPVLPVAAPPANQSWAGRLRGEKPILPPPSPELALPAEPVPQVSPVVPEAPESSGVPPSVAIEQPTHPAAAAVAAAVNAAAATVEQQAEAAMIAEAPPTPPLSPTEAVPAVDRSLPSGGAGRPTILRRPQQQPAPMEPPMPQHPMQHYPPELSMSHPQDTAPMGYGYNMPPPGVFMDYRGMPMESYYSYMSAPPQPPADLRTAYMMRQPPAAAPQPPSTRDMYAAPPPSSQYSYYPDYIDRRNVSYGYGRQSHQGVPPQQQTQQQAQQAPGFADTPGLGMPPMYMMATEHYSKGTPRGMEPSLQQAYGQYAPRQEYNMPPTRPTGYYPQATDISQQHSQSRATDQGMHRQGIDQSYGQQANQQYWRY